MKKSAVITEDDHNSNINKNTIMSASSPIAIGNLSKLRKEEFTVNPVYDGSGQQKEAMAKNPLYDGPVTQNDVMAENTLYDGPGTQNDNMAENQI